MLAGNIWIRNLHLLKETHVNAANALWITHNGASFISDLPHRAFERTIYHLQNQQNGKPECFNGALLPVQGWLHYETHVKLQVDARLLLEPLTFAFLAIANGMRPFAGIAAVSHIHMKLSRTNTINERAVASCDASVECAHGNYAARLVVPIRLEIRD